MKKAALIAFIVGAVLPFFWLCVAMILFNAPDLPWFYRIVDVTSPFWLLGWSYRGDLRIMPLNGVLYAGIAIVAVRIKQALIHRRPSATKPT